MFLTAVLGQFPEYRSLYAPSGDPAAPGVRRLQEWIDEAWKEGEARLMVASADGTLTLRLQGYDWEGRESMGGTIVGTKKWIGTTGQR
jgi:hypothetical protein